MRRNMQVVYSQPARQPGSAIHAFREHPTLVVYYYHCDHIISSVSKKTMISAADTDNLTNHDRELSCEYKLPELMVPVSFVVNDHPSLSINFSHLFNLQLQCRNRKASRYC